jgi:hypothetical protein
MDSKTQNTNNLKATERVNKLCNTTRGLSEKDITSVSYIVEKSSRIASVTFLLADVLDESNELRRELQKSAIGLVRDASKSARSIESRESLVSALLTLTVLLETASRSGQLSKMNTEILSDEITALGELINVIDWQKGRRFAEESFFGGEVPKELFTPEPLPTRSGTYIRQEREAFIQRPTVSEQSSGSYAPRAERDTESKGRIQYKERVQEVQKDRRASILGLVQKKDKITVRDVSNIIKDCSEKTLQRELLALVRQGVLKKEGERRWSTYSLV